MKQAELFDDLVERVAQVQEDIVGFSDLSKEQLNWKPAATAWSVAECLRHLITSHDAYWPNIQERVGSTAPRAPEGNTIRTTFPAKKLLEYVDPDRRKRVKNPSVFDPSRSEVPGSVVDATRRCFEELQRVIVGTEDLDWHRIRVTSPASRLLRFRLGDAYNILVTHGQRHLLQAREVTTREGFPTR